MILGLICFCPDRQRVSQALWTGIENRRSWCLGGARMRDKKGPRRVFSRYINTSRSAGSRSGHNSLCRNHQINLYSISSEVDNTEIHRSKQHLGRIIPIFHLKMMRVSSTFSLNGSVHGDSGSELTMCVLGCGQHAHASFRLLP